MSRFILPFQSVYDKNGHPLDGAQLFFFETGTSTPKDTYSDSSLTTANTNPVIADSQGQFGEIFLTGEYRVELKDKNDVTQPDYPEDGVNSDASKNIYAAVAALKLANLVVGQTATTQGYYAAGDGGGAIYLVVAAQAFDGFGDHELANGNIATLQSGSTKNIVLFGATGDGSTDDTLPIQAAIDSEAASLYFPPGTYNISVALIVDGSDCKRFFGDPAVGKGSVSTTLIRQTGGAGNYAMDIREAGVTLANLDFEHSTEDPEILIYAKRNGVENEDVDLYVISCMFNDFTSAVKVIGRGCNAIDSVFQSGNVGIELDFDPTQLEVTSELGQQPDDAFRSIVITGNRFHSIDATCVQNNGDFAEYVVGMEITNNHADQCNRFFQGSARHTNFEGNTIYLCDNFPFYFIVGASGSSTAVAKNVNIVGNLIMSWHTVELAAFPSFTRAAGVSDRSDVGILFEADVYALNIVGNTIGYLNNNAIKFAFQPAINVNINDNIFIETNLEGASFPIIDTSDSATVANCNISGNQINWTTPSTHFVGSSALVSDADSFLNKFNTAPTTAMGPAALRVVEAIDNGTWTPTITIIANVSAIVAYESNYSRVGDIVTVSGHLEIDPIATGSVQVELTLPIASVFASFINASGAFAAGTGAIEGAVRADAANNRLELLGNSSTTANTLVSFSATYRVLS